MIAVVIVLKLHYGFLSCDGHFFCKTVNVVRHLREQFLLGDAANAGIGFVHADIGDVVQLAEDAELREFSDTCKEHEA